MATYCIGWTLAFMYFAIIRGVGATEDGAIDFEFPTTLWYTFTMGPIFGAFSGYA